MDYRDILHYGLSEPEAKVYLAALELGEASAERIARKAGIVRTSIYHTFSLLREKRLLSLSGKNHRTSYSAEDPRKLREIAEENLTSLDRLLPELRAVANAIDKKPSVRCFEGPEEVKHLYRKLLEHPENEVQFWFSDDEQTPAYVEFWDKQFVPERIDRKIFARGISKNTEKARVQKEKDPSHFRKTRLKRSESYDISAEILLSGADRTMLISHRNMLGLLIEDRNIHDTLRSIFERHWNSLPE